MTLWTMEGPLMEIFGFPSQTYNDFKLNAAILAVVRLSDQNIRQTIVCLYDRSAPIYTEPYIDRAPEILSLYGLHFTVLRL